MSTRINAAGDWATCANNSSKQAAGYNSTHGADCYKAARQPSSSDISIREGYSCECRKRT